MEWGYSGKLVRHQALKAHKHKRKDLLNDMTDKRNDYQYVVNITNHPNLSILKDNMSLLHLFLTPDQEYQMVPIIGFRRAKSMKDILARA